METLNDDYESDSNDLDQNDDSLDFSSTPTKKRRPTQADRFRNLLMREREEKNRIIEDARRIVEERNEALYNSKLIMKDKTLTDKKHMDTIESILTAEEENALSVGDAVKAVQTRDRLAQLRNLKSINEDRVLEIDEENIQPKYDFRYTPDLTNIPTAKDLEVQEVFEDFLNRNPHLNKNSNSYDPYEFQRIDDLSKKMNAEYAERGLYKKINGPEFVRDLEKRMRNESNNSENSSKDYQSTYSPSLSSSSSSDNYSNTPIKNLKSKLTREESAYLVRIKQTIPNFDEEAYIRKLINRRRRG